MKKLLTLLLISMFVLNIHAQDKKKIAILPVVDKVGTVKPSVKFLLREDIANAINNTPGYIVLERVDISSVLDEQKFQRDGNVSDDEIKEIGKMSGAQYVLIISVVPDDEQSVFASAKIVDVVTSVQIKSTKAYRSSNQYEDLDKTSTTMAEVLLGKKSDNTTTQKNPTPRTTNPTTPSNQNFTETAFGVNMKMIWVEGGDFLMGCTSEQSGSCDSDEQNVRRVTVDGFYIGMLEVTQAQWEKVMGTSIYQQKAKASGDNTYGVGPDYPMYYVSWEEAMEFCRQLSIKTGRTYTLPTEAQWEYAARGGNRPDGTKYAGSNMIDLVAWYTDNSGGSTHICGSKRANSLGIYDMSGNVWEWCKDRYGNSYMSYDTNNPTGPSSGSYRVLRGGSWSGNARYCRVADRGYHTPTNRYDYVGFRVVLLP